ncbi:MAG: N-acetylmuramoyl-L-alanine amidase [Candidatus Binatia bacterium]|jgi:N-acetylmuramoyl-L-alanine amidase
MKTSILFAILLCLAVPGKNSLCAATYGQEVVAAVLLAEARGEGEKGMQAVAEVIRTRADKKGVTMLAVVKPIDFSSLNGTNRDALLKKYRYHPLFDEALKIARTAYNEPHLLTNVTRNATHFVVKTEAPWWARGKRPVASIGNHAFYRLARF